MPSFRAVVLGGKRNGEHKVYIRLTHNRRTRHLPTGLVAMPGDFRGGELTNGLLIDKTNEQMKRMRERCNSVGSSLLNLDVEAVARIATSGHDFDRDFLNYCGAHLERLLREGRTGTHSTDRSAVNSLRRFVGRDTLMYDEMTVPLVREYLEWLAGCGPRAQRQYFSTIATIYRRARREFNDTADGSVPIPRDPFSVVRAPAQTRNRKRALPAADVARIRDCETGGGLEELARDMFMLSFYLVGINAADLYELRWSDDTHVEYNRRKTRTRRADGAYMRLLVPEEAKPLLAKYADRHGETVLDFRNRYAESKYFKNAIGKGMKALGERLGIQGLTYYAARHTWATLAANDCGVDIYTVEKALCHKPPGLGMTETYIRPDYSRVDNANRLVLDRLEEEGL